MHAIVEAISEILAPDAFYLGSHYLIGLLDRLQYDTIYREHLRYYSVGSLSTCSKCIIETFTPGRSSHGGSIVSMARKGVRPIQASV
jgi:hypothetical protein